LVLKVAQFRQDAEFAGECVQITPLKNFANSCYMDSVLMILFTVLEEFTFNEIIRKDFGEVRQPTCDANPAKDKNVREDIRDAFRGIC
jgi:ubiquitin C-terminal hydrolase